VPGNIDVSIDAADTVPPALGDVDQLRIVFRNLIRNACDVMPDGGRLKLGVSEADGRVQVEVTDTGPGIPAERIHRIMEPFYSTKSRGLGLGLAVSRVIVEKNDGLLIVHSEPDKGTTFTVRLHAAGDENLQGGS
jgi:two-component system sensor kinase FixL